MKYDIELLKQMYWISSPSEQEHGLSGFLKHRLTQMNIEFDCDNLNQIWSFNNPDMPIICAHIDQVGGTPISKLYHNNDKIYADRNLGADDKNGVWICLELLKTFPDLNFVFSSCEEIGGNIQEIPGIQDIGVFPFCLVFDRKHKSDIIGFDNGYCSEEFENELLDIGTDYGFKSNTGLFSDCDYLSQYINCVNISCGYYNAHTDKEYTIVSELINSLEFGRAVIDSDLKYMHFPLAYENISYEDSYYLDIDTHCPVCGGELIDYVESSGGKEGLMCLTCHYEKEYKYEF